MDFYYKRGTNKERINELYRKILNKNYEERSSN